MKRSNIYFSCAVLGWFLLFMPPANLAAGNVLRTQGLINPGGNLKAGYLLINEMRVYIDKAAVFDHQGTPIRLQEFKPRRWVYIEIEKDPKQDTAIARKIYLLTHYVKPNETRKYPFMK